MADSQLRTIAVTSSGSSTPPSISNTLVLGGFAFGEYEHPSNLKFGITQDSVEMIAIGGTVNSQDLGAIHNDVTWSGIFRGSDAADRALVYKRMSYRGGEFLLKWLRERYVVKVKSFDFDYRTPNFGVYEITVKVLRDVAGQLKKANVTDVDQQTNALAQSANTFATAIVSADVSAAAQNLQNLTTAATAALPGIRPIASNVGSTSFLATVTTAIQAAQAYATQVAPYVQLANGVLPNSHLYNSLGLFNSLSLISANVTSGQPPFTSEVVGGTYSTLCATRYGDPTLWPQLAAANGDIGNIIAAGVKKTIVYPPFIGSKIA